jgi:hypothetical protein
MMFQQFSRSASSPALSDWPEWMKGMAMVSLTFTMNRYQYDEPLRSPVPHPFRLPVADPELVRQVCTKRCKVPSTSQSRYASLHSHFPITQLNTGTPRLTALRSYCVFFFLLQIEGCGNSASSKSNGAILTTACAHFVSVSRFGNCRNISNFSLLLYLLWWTVVSALRCLLL